MRQGTGRLRRWAAAALPTLAFLGLLELGLRASGFEFDAWYGEQSVFVPSGGGDRLRTRPAFTSTEPYGYALCQPQEFSRSKASGTRRVALLGASSVYRLGSAAALAECLRASARAPVEILNLGIQGCDSHRVLQSAREALALDLDALVVYAGHNEFGSPWNPARVREGLLPRRVERALFELRITQLAQRLALRVALPSRRRLERLRTRYESDAERAPIHAAYRRNLEGVARAARESGVPVVLSTVAYNYDRPPFGVRPDRRDARRALADGDLEAGVRRHPTDAFYAFAWAERLAARGRGEEARAWKERAFALDPTPLRSSEPLNEIVREVARAEQARLADVHRAVGSAVADRMPGYELFVDHCHLNERGNEILLAELCASIAAAWRE